MSLKSKKGNRFSMLRALCSMPNSMRKTFVLYLLSILIFASLAFGKDDLKVLKYRKSATFDIASKVIKWGSLSPEERRKLAGKYITFPLGDNSKTAILFKNSYANLDAYHVKNTEHFRIIWGEGFKEDLKKSVAWSWWDYGDDPIYVDKIAEISEHIWQKEVEELGFLSPPGASSYYVDIYVASTGVYSQDVSGSHEIDLPSNCYALTSVYQNGVPYIIIAPYLDEGLLKVTLAHEFFHAVEFAYLDLYELVKNRNRWWAEACAMWMEDVVYDSVNDYVVYINNWASTPWRSLLPPNPDNTDGVGFSVFHYGSVLFAKYLTEHYSQENDSEGANVMKFIWERISITEDALSAISEFLASQTVNPIKTFSEAMADFAIKNMAMEMNYEEGEFYKGPAISESFILMEGENSISLQKKKPQYYGACYVLLEPDDLTLSKKANRFNVDFYGDPQGEQWVSYIVFEREDGSFSKAYNIDMDALAHGLFEKIDPMVYSKAYLVSVPVPQGSVYPEIGNGFSYQGIFYASFGTRINKGWNLVCLKDLDTMEGFKSFLKTYGDSIISLWKWENEKQNWAVYLPKIPKAELEEYMSKMGFDLLKSCHTNEGMWINATKDIAEVEKGYFEQDQIDYGKGWTMCGRLGDSTLNVKQIESLKNFKSLWKWNSTDSTWEVYIPRFLQGELLFYVKAMGFSILKYIYPSEGFWVHAKEPGVIGCEKEIKN